MFWCVKFLSKKKKQKEMVIKNYLLHCKQKYIVILKSYDIWFFFFDWSWIICSNKPWSHLSNSLICWCSGFAVPKPWNCKSTAVCPSDPPFIISPTRKAEHLVYILGAGRSVTCGFTQTTKAALWPCLYWMHCCDEGFTDKLRQTLSQEALTKYHFNYT